MESSKAITSSRSSSGLSEACVGETFSSVMQTLDLLEPRETVRYLTEDFEIGNEGFLPEEDPATSSPRSDTSNKDPDAGANSDGAGEIDEGFVEEFCEGEDALALPRGAQQELNSELARPLDMQEIQQLLEEGAMENDYTDLIGVPSSSFLEDFDLGVDVLDSEQTSHSDLDYSQPMKSPMAHVPGSPYLSAPVPVQSPVGVGLPPCALPMGVGSPIELNLNSYNHLSSQGESEFVGGFAEYGSGSSSSGIVCNDSVPDVFCQGYDGFDMDMTFREPHGSPSPSVSSTTSSVPPQNSLTGFMLDQTQFISLSDLNHGGLHSLLPPTTASSPTTPVREKTFDFGRGTLPLPVDRKASRIKWEGGDSSSCSRGSQTSKSPSRSPSPSPYAASPPFTPSSIATLSPGTVGTPNDSQGATVGVDRELVDMPYYQFKKIIDDNEVSETDRSVAKTIRRRGKNKVAAKNCRQRKLDMIDGLQNEIDKLKVAKIRVEVKVRSLQKEIEAVRNHCTLVERSRLQS